MSDDAAPAGMLVVAAAVDHDDVARPHQLCEVVQRCRIRMRDADGDGGAGDALARQHGPDLTIDEAGMQDMADGRHLALLQQGDEVAGDLGRHRVDDEHQAFPVQAMTW